MFPILNPHPTSLLVPSLWVIPVHQPRAACILHQTWTGDSFHTWYYTCFNAILPNHPTLTLSHTHGEVGVSLLWGPCFFLLGPGVYNVLFVLCNFWGLYGGFNVNLLQEGLCHTQVCCTQSPCPRGRPLLTCISAGDTQTLKSISGSVSVGTPGVQKVLFEHSKHLWRIWGLILNMISHLLQSCLGFSFALGCGVSFFGGIQPSPCDGCLAVRCNFEVLGGEDECLSFYSAISDNTSVVHGQPKWWVRKGSQRILSRDELVIILFI